MTMNRTRRFVFPRGIWLVFAVCLGLAAWLQFTDSTGDRGMSNVFTFFLFLISALTAGGWFVFFSPFARRLRFGAGAAVLALLVLFFSLFRIAGVGAEMAPRFVWRFADAADRAIQERIGAAPAHHVSYPRGDRVFASANWTDSGRS